MIFRVCFSVAGDHVHCRLFCSPAPNQTYIKCGAFVVRLGEEFRALVESFSGADFIGDDETVGIAEASCNLPY